MIQGILIDPHIRMILGVEFEELVLMESLYRVIGCDTVEIVRIDNHTDMWLDESGLHKRGNPSFTFGKAHFAGRAVILGKKFDVEEGAIPCDTDWDLLKTADKLEWSDLIAVG